MHDSLSTRSALARGAFAVAILVSLVILFAPPPDVPATPPGVDKLVHGALFAALALTGRWAGIARAVLVGSLVGYAALSEVVQGMIGRDAAFGDLLGDVVGLLLGLAAWQWIARRGAR